MKVVIHHHLQYRGGGPVRLARRYAEWPYGEALPRVSDHLAFGDVAVERDGEAIDVRVVSVTWVVADAIIVIQTYEHLGTPPAYLDTSDAEFERRLRILDEAGFKRL